MSSELIPRSTIDEIVGYRDHAVALYEVAFAKINEAADAVRAAEAEVRAACGGRSLLDGPYFSKQAPEVSEFLDAVRLPDADRYMRVARRLTDARVWASLIERTDLEALMDKQAKDELRRQMEYVPEKVGRDGELINAEEIARGLPPVTVEAVEATLRGFAEEADSIFRRGVANAFSNLDRRFRSHDGFKFGARVVLSRVFDEWGSWSFYRNHRDTIADVERAFLVLDGRGPRAAYAGVVGKIDAERRGHSLAGGWQSEHEGEFFRVRVFKNGNAHLWFTRKDLLAKVNRLLAEHYGAAVGDGKDRDPDPEAPLERRAVGHARNLGWFPTPDDVAERVVEEALLHVHPGDQPLSVLEPSAGLGALARRAADVGARVDACELDAGRARALLEAGCCRRVWCGDFLATDPGAWPSYDRVVMNPPFDRGRDVDHVAHAWRFLKPGGLLVSVMSASAEFREDAKAKALRGVLKGARWRDLPAGSFAPATWVNASIVVARKVVGDAIRGDR